MLQMEDFRIAEVLYRQPKLGLDNYESNFDFQLMIKSKQSIPFLKKETYLSIVHDIYFEHYYSWYKVVDSLRSAEYKSHLEKEYEQIQKAVDQLAGDVILSNQGVSCAYYKAPDCHFNRSTAGFVPGKKQRITRKLFLMFGIPCVILVSFFATLAVYFLLKKMNIEPEMFSGLFAAISATFTGLMTFIFSTIIKAKS